MASERALKCIAEWREQHEHLAISGAAATSIAAWIDRHFPVPAPGKEAEAAAEHIVEETWQGICDAGDPKMRIVPPLRLRVELEACTKAIIAAAYADRIGKLEVLRDAADKYAHCCPCDDEECEIDRNLKRAGLFNALAALGETT